MGIVLLWIIDTDSFDYQRASGAEFSPFFFGDLFFSSRSFAFLTDPGSSLCFVGGFPLRSFPFATTVMHSRALVAYDSYACYTGLGLRSASYLIVHIPFRYAHLHRVHYCIV